MVGATVRQLEAPIHDVKRVESIGKQFVHAPVESNRETLPERFSWRGLERQRGAAVLEHNTWVLRVHTERCHCGHRGNYAGRQIHKRPPSLAATVERRGFDGFENLATTANAVGTADPAVGRRIFSILTGAGRSTVFCFFIYDQGAARMPSLQPPLFAGRAQGRESAGNAPMGATNGFRGLG